MDMKQTLLDGGFARVILLDALSCGAAEQGTLLLAFWTYEAEQESAEHDAWIHPYYYASQQAYRTAEAAVKASDGAWTLRDDIRVKPIFARLPGFSQGRNTLSYMDGVGSRFHVQILLSEKTFPADMALEEEHGLHCGSCRRCIEACPSGGIDEEGFHREKCLRNWMLSGKPIPEAMRKMGNRLLGCDNCQRCCPHQPKPMGEPLPPVSLRDLLSNPKETTMTLRPIIGSNLAIPNRALGQACLVAGCSGDTSLLPLLESLKNHPSPLVAEHAAWAVNELEKEQRPLDE